MPEQFAQDTGRLTLPESAPQPSPASNARVQLREERHRVAQQRHVRRTILLGITTGTLSVAALAILIAVLVVNGVLFASGLADPNYPPIAGVACQAGEMVAHHYHAHISLYVNGAALPIPADIGIAGVTPTDLSPQPTCFYWLHTHDTSGLIHIESATNQQFSLGNFLDIWSRKFPHAGAGGFPSALSQPGWVVYLNGRKQPASFDLHAIVFKPHLLITLAYHSPQARPEAVYNWGAF